jgi:hypothetical protein
LLSKCAHPTCFAQFRYLHEGRVFKLRVPAFVRHIGSHRIEHFWLCERCARSLTIVFEKGWVTTRPIYLELTAGKPESAPDLENAEQAA